jgi:hypothetical protein
MDDGLLDTYPFDWSRPDARRLRDALADVFPSREPVIEMIRRAGVSPGTISWDQEPWLRWHSLITEARKQERLRELLTAAAATDPRAAAALAGLLDAPSEG